MPETASETSPPLVPSRARRRRSALGRIARYGRRNPSLIWGLALLLGLALLWFVAFLATNPEDARPLSVRPNQAPTVAHPLGSDRQGRDILAVMVVGAPLTLRIGLIAGTVGLAIGTALAFISAYYGGLVDTVIRGVVDTLQTVPGLLVLVLIAISMPNRRAGLSVDQMALVVAALSWLGPTRQIRAQVLVLKQRSFVELARLSGMSGPEVIVKEMMPNLMPYIVANFVLAVSSAILASIGLEALGLGPMEANTLGMTIYWNIYYTSILHGLWWWYGPPILVIVLLFVGLLLVTVGLDEWANPRLRQRV